MTKPPRRGHSYNYTLADRLAQLRNTPKNTRHLNETAPAGPPEPRRACCPSPPHAVHLMRSGVATSVAPAAPVLTWPRAASWTAFCRPSHCSLVCALQAPTTYSPAQRQRTRSYAPARRRVARSRRSVSAEDAARFARVAARRGLSYAAAASTLLFAAHRRPPSVCLTAARQSPRRASTIMGRATCSQAAVSSRG